VLDPVSGENLLAPIVHVDRAGDDDGALRIEEPVAIGYGNGEMIGDDVELFAGHLEHGTRIKALHMRSPWAGGGSPAPAARTIERRKRHVKQGSARTWSGGEVRSTGQAFGLTSGPA
jgi:hypothetical protein